MNLPKIKRHLFSVSTKTEYTLLGVWGFSEEHIVRKLKRLMKHNDVKLDSGFGIDREVNKFPSYCTWII